MKIIKTITMMLIATALFSGCMNVMIHTSDDIDEPSRVYQGTYENSKAIALLFDSDAIGEESILRGELFVISPLVFIDWPLEVVADTLTLPYDLIYTHKSRGGGQ